MNQKNYLEIIDQLSKENDELNNNLQKALDIIKEKINTVLERMSKDGTIEDLVLKHSK